MGLVSRCNNASTWEAALRAGKSGPFCRCLLRSNGLHHFAGALCALRKDHPTRFLRTWTIGWTILTVKALLELTQVTLGVPQLRLARVLLLVIVNLVFLKSVFQQARGARGAVAYLWPSAFVVVLAVFYVESRPAVGTSHISWLTSSVVAHCQPCRGVVAVAIQPKDRWPWREIDGRTIFS